MSKGKGRWARGLSRTALLLSVGGIGAALVAAVGTGSGWWAYGVGLGVLRYALPAAALGGLLAVVAWILARRSAIRVGWPNGLALVASLLFVAYLGNMILTARSLPMIHDATTDLADVPQFATLKVRDDNLARVPDLGRADLRILPPEERWKALHREAYGDLRPLRLPVAPEEALSRAEQLVHSRGWDIARIDPAAGTLEATATTFFFRFKDDVVIRVRADPQRPGSSIVDMRSISRVGLSDIGVNARRIRRFLADLESAN